MTDKNHQIEREKVEHELQEISTSEHPIQELIHTKSRSLKKRVAIEAVILGLLYGFYTVIRNTSEASASRAFENAKSVINFQEQIGISIEQSVHTYFLDYENIIVFANYFYGSLHFIATLFAIIFVFARDPHRYPVVRNTIVISTLLALGGFLLYPLMPPRLLPASYGYLDTLAQYPTFWSFNSEQFAAISNQYAAMPSVHVIWATWVAFALFPYTKNIFYRIFLIGYPTTTFFVIIITANHYILDAIVGWIILVVAYLVSRMISSKTTRSAIDNTASLDDINAK